MSNEGVSVGSLLSRIWRLLMIAERTRAGLNDSKDKEMIEKMAGELADIIEDFKGAVDVEALCLAKKSGKRSFP
jgi:hypothetical protein